MTAEQVNRMRDAALSLLADAAAGRKCDPEGIRWARQLLAANPTPKREAPNHVG